MDKQVRKELLENYKEREVIGGIYAIRNTLNNKLYVDDAVNLQGAKNRFDFATETGTCIHLKLLDDWTEQSGSHFVFEVLEELKKGSVQSAEEFKADVETLKEIWLEKLSDEHLY